MAEPVAADAGSRAPGYETTDASAAMLGKVAVAVVVLLITVFIGILILFKVLDYSLPILLDRQPHPLAETRQQASGPFLQLDPPRQKFDLQAAEDQVLTTYDWVDREQGLVRIPIDRAIAILARHGSLSKIDTTTTGTQP